MCLAAMKRLTCQKGKFFVYGLNSSKKQNLCQNLLIFCSEVVELLHEAAVDPFVDERYIDLLARYWNGIKGNMQYRKYLTQILPSLGRAVVSEKYLKVLQGLSQQPKSSSEMEEDAVDAHLLENAINIAHNNLKWINQHYRMKK